MKYIRQSGKEGTTLIEVALAIIVLAVIAMAAMTALRYPRFRAVADANRQVAVIAANSAMEQAISMDFNSISNAAGTYALSSDLSARNTMNGSSISGSRVVEDLNDGSSDYKRVTVSINYDGSEQPVSLQTLIYP